MDYLARKSTRSSLSEEQRSIAVVVVATMRPPAWRRPGFAFVGVSAVFLVGWQLRTSHPPAPPTGLRLTVLDVGQGDAILLQVPEGRSWSTRASRSRGRRPGPSTRHPPAGPARAHPSARPCGRRRGARACASGRILDPAIPNESADEAAALAAARARRVPIVEARAGIVFRLGRLRLRLLWPDGAHPPGVDPNLRATVILASYGKVDALLTADAETPVTPLRPPPAEILQVAHHGSADEGLPRLLQLTRPVVAVISCGRDNDYGHPAPTTIAALTAAPRLDVLRTDQDGR